MWYPRFLTSSLQNVARQFPVVTLTGPRQSGKTSLVKHTFPDYTYVSLELPDQRAFAHEDPRGFLRHFSPPVIFDEIQRVPNLLSYLQVKVDEHPDAGQYILTGSHNFLLHESIAQSLAGRTALLYLLPFSKRELFQEPDYPPDQFPPEHPPASQYPDLWQIIFQGFYPRIHANQLNAHEWYAYYYQTYIERDVRLLVNIGDLQTFDKFIRLCAGRSAQVMNYSTLAADAGISVTTAKRWLSILQASFIIAMVPPHFENFRKRLIKSPKLYFLDTGLLTFLLNIRTPQELAFHALRGAVFETFVFSELYKLFLHHNTTPTIYFWHDVKHHEVDFILDRGSVLLPIEAKSGETVTRDQFRSLKYYQKLAGTRADTPVLVYGGDTTYLREGIRVLSWQWL